MFAERVSSLTNVLRCWFKGDHNAFCYICSAGLRMIVMLSVTFAVLV